MKIWLKIFLLSIISLQTVAQYGGEKVFNFSKLPFSARNTALGGEVLAINDNDISLASINPALTNKYIDGYVNLNYTNYFAGVNIGDIAYSKHFKKIGSLITNIKYINYGKFQETDYTGMITGDFLASDYLFAIGYAYKLDSMFTAGIKGNFIYSVIDKQKATALTTDVAINYYNEAKQLSVSFMLRNYGRELKNYYDNQEKNKIQHDFVLSISKKLPHTPFRFAMSYNNIQKFDYWSDFQKPIENDINILTGEPIEQKKISSFDKTLRHLTLGTELVVSQNFHIRFGYNHNRRQTMKIETKSGIIGFSWGFGFKIKKFRIDYASSKYHFGGNLNTFSITTNINEFKKK